MTKILFLTQLPPPIHGAAVVSKSIIESTIITAKYDFDIVNITTAASIDDINRFSFQKIYRAFQLYFLVFKKCATNSYQAAYITPAPTGNSFFKDFLFLLIIKLFKIPTIIHLHGKGLQQTINESWVKRRMAYIGFEASNVIHLSDMLLSDIKGVPCNKTHILNNGIPNNKFIKVPNIGNKPLKLLFLSNLVVSKGIIDFLDSLVCLKNDNIPFEVTIIGKPYDISKEEVADFIEIHGLQNQVVYLGGTYGEEKDKILLNSNILVFPTYYANECFPLVILEAMQAGLVVISTREGAIPEIIDEGETGFLVNKKSPQEIADSIKLLDRNRMLLQQMSINAQNKFKKKYIFEIFEQNFIQIIGDILTNSK